jgi:hypothetical protein
MHSASSKGKRFDFIFQTITNNHNESDEFPFRFCALMIGDFNLLINLRHKLCLPKGEK